MYYSVVLFIALRYTYSKTTIQYNKYISWVSSFSIILSIIAIIIILSIMNGFERELHRNILYFIPHVIITAVKGHTHVQDIPHCLLNKIYNDVLYIKPLVISKVILQSAQKISFGIMFGINPNDFDPISKCLINNKINQLIPNKYYVIIGSTLAQQLSVNINDQIRLTIPSVRQTVLGNDFPSQRLCTVSDIYVANNEIDSYQILIHQEDAAKLMHYPSQCVTGWRLWLREPFNLNKFNQLNISNNKDWKWKDWSQSKGSLFQAIKIEKNVMFALFVLIILVIGFNVSSFLVLSIMDRKKEIAILRTYGFNRFQVMLLFMIQVLYKSITNVIFGTIIGVVLSKNLNQILYFFNVLPKTLLFPIEIQYSQILIVGFVVCIINMLITLYPSWYISSIRPVHVLHHD